MDTLQKRRLIHPIEVRRAFGADPEHRPVAGQILAAHGGRAVVALITGARIVVALDDPRDELALRRPDLTRSRGRELVLLNARYGLLGLAIGPESAPTHLEVRYTVSRLQNGSVVEIPGEGCQPGWLIFRCTIDTVPVAGLAGEPVNERDRS